MRTLLTIVLTLCSFSLHHVASANEPVKKAAVRELEFKVLPRKPSGQVQKPTVIAKINELAECLGYCLKERMPHQLAKEVDFQTERLLVFTWSGSAQDQFTFEFQECKVMKVRFHHQRGLTGEARPHVRLVVVPRNASWSVTEAKTTTE